MVTVRLGLSQVSKQLLDSGSFLRRVLGAKVHLDIMVDIWVVVVVGSIITIVPKIEIHVVVWYARLSCWKS